MGLVKFGCADVIAGAGRTKDESVGEVDSEPNGRAKWRVSKLSRLSMKWYRAFALVCEDWELDGELLSGGRLARISLAIATLPTFLRALIFLTCYRVISSGHHFR